MPATVGAMAGDRDDAIANGLRIIRITYKTRIRKGDIK